MDTMKLIDDRINDLGLLYARMDATKDRVYNVGFKLKGFDNKPMDNVINVTMPYAAIFANAVVNDLMGAVRQTVIEGDISDKQTHLIEGFLDDNRAQADELLRRKGLPPLSAWWCNHVCIRSLIGVRWITLTDGENYKMYPLPLDMRYVPFEYGNDGLNYACNITYRTKAKVEEEYPEAEVTQKTDIEVRDYWDSEKNEVWIAKKMVKTVKNPFGYPPFVIAAPATGFMLRDVGYLEHESEDLLFLIRDLYDEVNRQVSIEQTLAMESIRPPYEYEVDEIDARPPSPPPKTGQTKKVKKGELHKLVQRPDVNNAFMAARQDISRALQIGGVNDIDLGNVSQTVSAVWITVQNGIRQKFTNPRLEAIADAEQQLSRMMIDQYIKISEGADSPLEIGVIGRKKKYAAAQLGDPSTYTIEHRVMTRSKTQEIANWAVANSARDLAPTKIILKDILMVDDPDGWMREKEIEEARQADPAISLFEMALRYAEEADETADSMDADAKRIQSMMLTERGCALIRQRSAEQTQLPQEASMPQARPIKANSQGLMSLPKLIGAGSPRPTAQPLEATNESQME